MDAETAIRLAVKSGRTVLGTHKTLHALRTGNPKVIVLASNAPPEIVNTLTSLAQAGQVPIHHYRNTSWELGQLCGRPHMVAAMAILDPGDADISSLIGATAK